MKHLSGLGIPRVYPREVRRNRLLEQMRKAQDHSILALVAPSGYGKTTLLAQFARSARRKVLWLTLDESHQDPALLASDLALVLHSVFQEVGLLGWNLDHTAHLSAEAQALTLARLMNHLDQNLYVILDRTEMLSRVSGQWLQRFHARISEGHQLLLAGYESSPLPFAKWLSRGEAAVWGTEELVFTLSESRDVLGDQQDTLLHVHEQLEGWPAGVALVASGAQVAVGAADLIEERLWHLPPEHARHFHELAVLQVWTEAEARAVGCQVNPGWLEAALQIGLPLSPLSRGKYRPHTLLLDVLNDMFLREDPQRYHLLCERQGDRLLKEGQDLAATFYYLRARNLNKSEPLVKSQIQLALANLNIDLILRLIQEACQLPDAPDEDYQLYKVLALLNIDKFEEAHQIVKSTSFEHRTDLYYQTLSYFEYRRGNYQKQLELAQEGLQVAETDYARQLLYTYQGMALGGLLRHQEKIQALEMALTLALKDNNTVSEARIYSMLGDAYGDLHQKNEAIKSYERASEVFRKLGHFHRINEIHHNLACGFIDWGRFAEANHLVQYALTEKIDGFILWEPLFLGLKSRIHRIFNKDLETCIEDLKQAWQDAEKKGWTYHSYTFLLYLAECYAVIGKFEDADFCLSHALVKIKALDLEMDEYHFHQIMVEVHKTGTVPETCLTLEWCMEVLNVDSAVRLCLMQLEVKRQQGTLSRADIDHLMEKIKIYDSHAVLTTDLRHLQDLYQTCIAQQWHPAFFQRLLTPHTLEETSSSPLVLHLETLGGFSCKINDQPLVLPLKKSQELLLLLALHGPQTRDQLIALLWEQGSAREHLDYFKVAVRKLRLALKDSSMVDIDPIEFREGIYQLNPLFQVSIDLQPALDLKHSEVQPGQHQVLENMLDRAILPQFDAEWLDLLRTTTHDLLVARLLQHAAQHRHDLTLARSICEKIIALHPLEEAAHLLLLKVLTLHGLEDEIPEVSQLHQQRLKHALLK